MMMRTTLRFRKLIQTTQRRRQCIRSLCSDTTTTPEFTDQEKIDAVLKNERKKKKLTPAERAFFVNVFDHNAEWRERRNARVKKEEEEINRLREATYDDANNDEKKRPIGSDSDPTSTIGKDLPLQQIYEERYAYAEEPPTPTAANLSRNSKKRKDLRPQVRWVPGDRGDGIDTLVDYDSEPFHAQNDLFDKEMESYDWAPPKKALSPQEMYHAAGYSMWYLYDDRVVKMTAKGKKQSFRALVCVGNGNGTAGYGVGKADTVPVAYDRALMDARKNLIYLDLCQGRTLWEPLVGEWNNTKVLLKPAKEGRFRVSDTVLAVANCFGIKQLSSKTFGRNNPYVVIKAIFDAFQNFRTVEDIALARGKRIVDVHSLKEFGGSEDGRNAQPSYMGAYTRT